MQSVSKISFFSLRYLRLCQQDLGLRRWLVDIPQRRHNTVRSQRSFRSSPFHSLVATEESCEYSVGVISWSERDQPCEAISAG
jgi:hypothetical protein